MVKVNNPIIQEPVSSLICCFLYDDNTGLKQLKYIFRMLFKILFIGKSK